MCASFSPLFQDSTLSQVLANLLPFLHVCADTLLPILTVEEMLLYTAELKRPRSIPLADKQAAVEELLDKLGLNTCRWAAASGCGLVSTVCMVRRVLWELPWWTPSWVRCMAAAAARAASPLCRTQDIQGCGVMCWPWAGTACLPGQARACRGSQ